MKIIIGLGNPGKNYINNRHNAGHMVVEALQKIKLPKDVVVKKTDVFMNESGSFVKRLISIYPNTSLSDLYVIHDDLDIPIGSFKIQFGKGPKDHNGIKSINDEIGSNKYWHVRVGIDNRFSDNRTLGEEYVLQDFNPEERQILARSIKELVRQLVKFKPQN